MRRGRISLLVATALCVMTFEITPTWADDDVDYEQAYRLAREGRIMSLDRILARHPDLSYVRLLEVELEWERGQYLYEIEFLGNDGRVWEWLLDARNGDVVSRELED